MKKIYSLTLIALSALALNSLVNAQVLYNNGPLANSLGTGAGGADESMLYTTTFGMGTIGFGHQSALFNRVADDFVNPNCIWQIDSIVFFGYQTGSTTTSTFTGVNFRIWDSIPDAPGSNVVYGDTITNRMTRTVWSGVYRITETTTGATNRPIMRNVCATPGLTLQAGTFWIDWASLGSLASGPWAVPRVPLNTAITGNGRQRIGSVWNNALDGGTNTPAQGFPFIIYGTIIQPTAAAGSDVTICAGASQLIGGSPAGSGGTGVLTYSWSPSGSLNNSSVANPIATPATSTSYVLTVTDALGCFVSDTIQVNVLQPTTSSAAPVVCGSFLSPAGNTYTTSGTYLDTLVNSQGCDSIITINLTVNNATSSSINPAACYQYLSPSGNTYNASGTYLDTITNVAGCDSVITINLTINGTTTSTLNISTCDPFTSPSGMLLTASGTYLDTIANMNSCDSVITINLAIDTLDLTVSMSGVTLSSNENGATYQWVNCDSGYSVIAGATSQSYFPLADGNYAVIITGSVCSDTSACINVIGTGVATVNGASMGLYPNPSDNTVNLVFGQNYAKVVVVIRDLNGRAVYTSASQNTTRMEINPEIAAGMYILEVNADGNIMNRPMIRQ
jgi:hypothetical protein